MANSFGAFLRQKRTEKNLTQKELAEALFVSESAVSKWENDVAHPDITMLPKLSEILGASEHELITASIDNRAREERKQAKKWRTFSLSLSVFFYIAYGVALITCFICNLAIEGTLSWFFLVLFSILLAFSFTNLPNLIRKYKLILIPLSQYSALVLLLGACCHYTGGNWFWIPVLSVLLGFLIIFVPIYIAKYRVFQRLKGYNDFLSVAVDFLVLNVLLIVINVYTLGNGYDGGWWYSATAFPIVLCVYLVLNILLSVRFLKTNKFAKTGIILSLTNVFLYLPPLFIKVENPALQRELDDINIFKADLSSWQASVTLEQNIHLLVFLTLLLVSLVFLCIGAIRHHRRNRG